MMMEQTIYLINKVFSALLIVWSAGLLGQLRRVMKDKHVQTTHSGLMFIKLFWAALCIQMLNQLALFLVDSYTIDPIMRLGHLTYCLAMRHLIKALDWRRGD